MSESAFINRWRIMALLVEKLQLKQYVTVSDILPYGVRYDAAVEVLEEACMERITQQTYTPGKGTYEWLLFHLGFIEGGFSWRHRYIGT